MKVSGVTLASLRSFVDYDTVAKKRVNARSGGGAWGTMRIIAGKWRSRRLAHPAVEATRPMPDRLKEAVFSMLGTRFDTPGALPSIRVADVFAGSGSAGLEALSRGAASCVFFERNPEVVKTLKANIQALDAGSQAEIITGDAWRAAVAGSDRRPFDLVLLDPPYVDTRDTSPSGPVQQFLIALSASPDRQSLVVLHHPADSGFADTGGWRVGDQRVFGTGAITIFHHDAT